MIKDIAPLDWYNVRYLAYIPVHFVTVPLRGEVQETLEWCERITAGRFAIAEKEFMTDAERRSIFRKDMLIGFEDPAEATMYTMFYI